MAIDQLNVVDFAATNPTLNQVVLVISDHLEWTDDDESNKLHMYLLQQKVNAYLEFVESGEIYRSYPKAVGKSIVINVVAKFPMNNKVATFFEKVRSIVLKLGYDIEFENPRD
jgi:Family of unknown function (DUF6572)